MRSLFVLISFMFSVNLVYANNDTDDHHGNSSKSVVHKKTTYEEAYPIFESLSDFEIVLGTGSRNIVVFVDPMCPHSRNFIEMISTENT